MPAVLLADRFDVLDLPRDSAVTVEALPKGEIAQGLTTFEAAMVWRDGDEFKVWDRVCDHAGGRLISRAGAVTCPLHGWGFDPRTGLYDNGVAAKTPSPFRDAGDALHLDINVMTPRLPQRGGAQPVTIRFLNHACLLIEAPGVRFATDPWLVGSAFCDGWWLAQPSPVDAIEAVNACDFIYVSHNHPDHLHPETLKHLRRDMPILTAEFLTQSTVLYLRDLGFENILPAVFGKAYLDRASDMAFTVLKSGDFRDDSGLYFTIGDFSAVLTVDSNYLNFNRLPKDITLLASSFAGAASGFPLCFDTYDLAEKRRIVARDQGAMMALVELYMQVTRPTVYLPYAGFYTEHEGRDGFIKTYSSKHATTDYREMAERNGVRLIDVVATPIVRFDGAVLCGVETDPQPPMPAEDRDARLADSAARFVDLSDDEVAGYFAGSGFSGQLLLHVAITDDAFAPEAVYRIDFRAAPPEVTRLEAVPDCRAVHAETGVQASLMRIRRPAFVRTVREGLPWEDLSIGFQARFDRAPNTYEADFWFHFTNVHVAERARRAAIDCGGSCKTIQAALYG